MWVLMFIEEQRAGQTQQQQVVCWNHRRPSSLSRSNSTTTASSSSCVMYSEYSGVLLRCAVIEGSGARKLKLFTSSSDGMMRLSHHQGQWFCACFERAMCSSASISRLMTFRSQGQGADAKICSVPGTRMITIVPLEVLPVYLVQRHYFGTWCMLQVLPCMRTAKLPTWLARSRIVLV